MKISIYRLVNPLDDSTFYIGATKLSKHRVRIVIDILDQIHENTDSAVTEKSKALFVKA